MSWTADEKDIRVAWREAGGPVTRVPDDTGFGTRLIQATVSGTGGEIEYQWADEDCARTYVCRWHRLRIERACLLKLRQFQNNVSDDDQTRVTKMAYCGFASDARSSDLSTARWAPPHPVVSL